MPAGGSLTADQWKNLALVLGPIIVSIRTAKGTGVLTSLQVPQLWQQCLPDDPGRMLDDRVKRIELEDKRREDKKKVAAVARAAKRAKKDAADIAAGKKPKKTRQSKGKEVAPAPATVVAEDSTSGSTMEASNPVSSSSAAPAIAPTSIVNQEDASEAAETDQGPEPPFSLHPDDPKNFLKLSESLRLLSQRIISEEDICLADRLLREYNTELITVRRCTTRLSQLTHTYHTALR